MVHRGLLPIEIHCAARVLSTMVVAQEQVRKEELAPGSADEVHEFTSPGSSQDR